MRSPDTNIELAEALGTLSEIEDFRVSLEKSRMGSRLFS